MKKLEETKPVVLGGDLNVAHKEIDIYDTKGKEKVPGFSPQERKSFDDFLSGSGFIDTFRYLHPEEVKYTFWSVRANLRPANKGWRLDYFLASSKAMPYVQESLIHNEYYGSDHCPISLQLNFSKKAAAKDEKDVEEKVEKKE